MIFKFQIYLIIFDSLHEFSVQWSGGYDAVFPIQGFLVQNYRVAPMSILSFYPSEVDQMSTRNFWELSGNK